MLSKIESAIRIQQVMRKRGLYISPVEAYDAWTRYSLSQSREWVDLNGRETDETIYRKIRNHIFYYDKEIHLFSLTESLQKTVTAIVESLHFKIRRLVQQLRFYSGRLQH